MRVPRVHTPQKLAPGVEVELEGGPSQHLGRVLRMGTGAELTLFNGDGAEYSARITGGTPKRLVVGVEAQQARDLESPLSVHLGIGMSRGERMDHVVQKATELGVALIQPLSTARSELRLSAGRLEKKCRHWQQVAVSACEQCGRNRVPPVCAPQSLAQWVEAVQAPRRLVLTPGAPSRLPDPQAAAPREVALLVGPEGGLSGDDVALATGAGFRPWGLGPRILRTETAPLAALAVLQAYWGDLTD